MKGVTGLVKTIAGLYGVPYHRRIGRILPRTLRLGSSIGLHARFAEMMLPPEKKSRYEQREHRLRLRQFCKLHRSSPFSITSPHSKATLHHTQATPPTMDPASSKTINPPAALKTASVPQVVGLSIGMTIFVIFWGAVAVRAVRRCWRRKKEAVIRQPQDEGRKMELDGRRSRGPVELSGVP